MNGRRVVVTGMGIVSPVGNSLDKAWNNIKNGISGIDQVTHFDASDIARTIAGEVSDLPIENYIKKKDAKKMDPFMHYGIVAGVDAINDANFDILLETKPALSTDIFRSGTLCRNRLRKTNLIHLHFVVAS